MSIGCIVHLLVFMNYSGLAFVQLGYWIIENYLLEHFERFTAIEMAIRDQQRYQ